MLGDNQTKQNAVAMVMVKPGAGAGGQRVGAVRSGARADGGEKAGVRPAEAGREYQVNTLTLTFTFRRTINVETIG